jgi:DNA-binding PadR family transcriptional regulator
VDRLERGGLVARREDGAERRRVVIELTEKARQVVARLRGNHERVIAAIDRLPRAAQEPLAEGMEALADELERERERLDPPRGAQVSTRMPAPPPRRPRPAAGPAAAPGRAAA